MASAIQYREFVRLILRFYLQEFLCETASALNQLVCCRVSLGHPLHFNTPLGTFDFFKHYPVLNNSNQFLFYDPNVNIAAFSLYESHLIDVVDFF